MRKQVVIALICWLIVILGLFVLPTRELLVPLTGDKLDWESKKLADRDAVDCGRVWDGEEARQASTCALSAFHSSKPFRVRYHYGSGDESLGIGLVGTRDGRIFYLSFQGGAPDGQIHYLSQRVEKQLCPQPIAFRELIVWTRHTGIMTCMPLMD